MKTKGIKWRVGKLTKRERGISWLEEVTKSLIYAGGPGPSTRYVGKASDPREAKAIVRFHNRSLS